MHARPRVSPRAAFEGESPIPLSTRSVAVDNTIFPNSTQHNINKPSRFRGGENASARQRAPRSARSRLRAGPLAVTRVRTTRRRRTRRRRPVSDARPARKTGVARPRCGVHADPGPACRAPWLTPWPVRRAGCRAWGRGSALHPGRLRPSRGLGPRGAARTGRRSAAPGPPPRRGQGDTPRRATGVAGARVASSRVVPVPAGSCRVFRISKNAYY